MSPMHPAFKGNAVEGRMAQLAVLVFQVSSRLPCRLTFRSYMYSPPWNVKSIKSCYVKIEAFKAFNSLGSSRYIYFWHADSVI